MLRPDVRFVPTTRLAGDLRLRVYFEQLANVIQTDKTVPLCTINAVSLRLYGKQIEDQREIARLVNQQKAAGMLHFRTMSKQIQSKVPLTAGSTTYNVLMSSVVGYVSHMMIICRASASVNSGASYANAQDAYKEITSMSIKNNAGGLITGVELDGRFMRDYLSTNYLTGDLTDRASGLAGAPKNVYLISFNQDPESSIWKGRHRGGYTFTATGETLALTFSDATQGYGSGLDVASVCDIVTWSYGLLGLDANGRLTKIT